MTAPGFVSRPWRIRSEILALLRLAEDVIYIVRGEDVREGGEKEVRKGLRAPGP